MSRAEFLGPIPVRITPNQQALVTTVVLQLTQLLDDTAPGDEQVERLRDYDRTIIGGVFVGISVLFGDDAERNIKDTVQALHRQETGSDPPSLIPRVLADGEQSGVFKKQLYGQLRWTLPEDPK